MAPKTKLWKLDEHTVGKHLVLKSYLHAWLPIMSLTNDSILIIDGFSGPGEYSCGESGSPIIMLNSYLEHYFEKHFKAFATYYFIEQDKSRFEHLNNLIMEKYQNNLPKGLKVQTKNSSFDEQLSSLLSDIEKHTVALAPSFVMIDPFGVSDTPMKLLAKLFKNPKSEIYISFMYEHINRFKGTPEFEKHLTALFGTDEWKESLNINDKKKRKEYLSLLYKKQLKLSGAKHVVSFDLYKGNRVIYTIFFATQHWKGSDKMKDAIWKNIPDGTYKYVGRVSGEQASSIKIDYSSLKNQIKKRFLNNNVTIEDLLEYIGSDATDYPTTGIKTKMLKAMEINNELEVISSPRKRVNTYPSNTVIKFTSSIRDLFD